MFLLWLVFFSVLGLYYASQLVRGIRKQNLTHIQEVLAELGITDTHTGRKIVGFFHPYCNAGGGGERVLWTAVALNQRTEPDIVNIIYSGDTDASKEDIILKVKARFDIELSPNTLHFIFLHKRYLIESTTWPRFTLLGQSIGSMVLAWEAMSKLIPDLFIDTMGYAFTFHVVRWVGGVHIGAYVHYPTISTDMLERVKSRKEWHTNSNAISSSSFLSGLKLIYYRVFMYYYAYSLRQASFVMVNSRWTKNHVDSILRHSDPLLDLIHAFTPLAILKIWSLLTGVSSPDSAQIVYPPCDAKEMAKFPLEGRERVIMSLAQFRPEKDHAAQLHAFQTLLKTHPEYQRSGEKQVRLVLIGGSRDAGDAARVESLKSLAKELGIEANVQFIVNASYAEMLKWLSLASIGLSTMVDEHFGINVVELMAAGVIPITHASGGPLHDIVVPYDGKPTGYHATTPESFAQALHEALTLPPEEEVALRRRARTWAIQRFSQHEFELAWNASGWKDWIS
ncbi:glycosyltransferase family 4 protein [Panus rudis PR-1116 ss-1]|nr:glycosyltransferase family 4 protein [Panus rudis PR-1116 ss-1]